MNRWSEWWGVELNVVSLREKFVSMAGGLLAIVLLVFAARTFPDLPGGVGLVASMGASAVLLFAVPHGQLSQPWPVLAGHVVSAAIGVACAKWIAPVEVAAACAVGLSIGAMHGLKCIHPPGGATALTAVLGGPAVQALGFQFVLLPVAANAAFMVAAAVAYNRFFPWRRYPAAAGHQAAGGVSHERIVEAVRGIDSFVDITEDDLRRLVEALSEPVKKARKPGGSRAA
jgi:CBS-domain-containing membrane protein